MSAGDKLIVLIDAREGILLSWGRDLVSFGGLIGSAIAINTLMPPSGWLNAALAVSWILWLAGRGATRKLRMTLPELQVWLDAQHAPTSPEVRA